MDRKIRGKERDAVTIFKMPSILLVHSEASPKWTSLFATYFSAADRFYDYVAVDDTILHGTPHIRGTRIPIWVILRDVAEGYSIDEISQDYPPLTVEQVQQAIAYAAAVRVEVFFQGKPTVW